MAYPNSKLTELRHAKRPAKPDTTKGQHSQLAKGDANICPTASLAKSQWGVQGGFWSIPPAKLANIIPLGILYKINYNYNGGFK